MARNKPKKKSSMKKSSILFTLDDSDFRDFFSVKPLVRKDQILPKGIHRMTISKVPPHEFTTTEKKLIIMRNFPKVIASKIKEMVPDGFELTELSFTGEISGKPFGVGLSGSVTATFTKSPSP